MMFLTALMHFYFFLSAYSDRSPEYIIMLIVPGKAVPEQKGIFVQNGWRDEVANPENPFGGQLTKKWHGLLEDLGNKTIQRYSSLLSTANETSIRFTNIAGINSTSDSLKAFASGFNSVKNVMMNSSEYLDANYYCPARDYLLNKTYGFREYQETKTNLTPLIKQLATALNMEVTLDNYAQVVEDWKMFAKHFPNHAEPIDLPANVDARYKADMNKLIEMMIGDFDEDVQNVGRKIAKFRTERLNKYIFNEIQKKVECVKSKCDEVKIGVYTITDLTAYAMLDKYEAEKIFKTDEEILPPPGAHFIYEFYNLDSRDDVRFRLLYSPDSNNYIRLHKIYEDCARHDSYCSVSKHLKPTNYTGCETSPENEGVIENQNDTKVEKIEVHPLKGVKVEFDLIENIEDYDEPEDGLYENDWIHTLLGYPLIFLMAFIVFCVLCYYETEKDVVMDYYKTRKRLKEI